MRSLFFYILTFLFLVFLVVVITWQFGYVDGLQDLAVVIGLASVGVATVMALFVPLFERVKKKSPSPNSSAKQPIPRTPTFAKASLQEVTQTGGVGFGQGSIVTVYGDVIGTQIHEGISPELVQEILAVSQPGQLSSSLHQLEPPPADFTGRENEIEKLLSAIESGSLDITGLFGMGGVGKTALALKLAEQLTPTFPDAQIYLNLRGTDPIASFSSYDAMAHVIHSFHPNEQLPKEDWLKSRYLSVLHGKKVFLLMDNARDKKQVEDLIPPSGCILLITSRQHFTLPGMKDIDLEILPPLDARNLLLEISSNLEDIADELAQYCGFLPLALRVSASTLHEHPDYSPEDFIHQLQDLNNRLDLTGAEASLQLSYNLLPPDLQHGFCSLSVFQGSFNLEAASAVLDLDKDLSGLTLTSLINNSLLEYNPITARYEMHDLVRLLASKLLGDTKRFVTQKRHAAYFRDILGASDNLFFEGGEKIFAGLSLFDLEHENILVGQAWAMENSSSDESIARLCMDYSNVGSNILNLKLHPLEWIHWLEASLSSARLIGHRRGEGIQLGNIGNAFAAMGNNKKAIYYYIQALEISEEIGDRYNEGMWLANLGNSYRNLGEFDRAIEYLEKSLSIARDKDDRRGEGARLSSLGIAYAVRGEIQQSIDYYKKSLSIVIETGDKRGESQNLGSLGLAYAALGYLKQAIESYKKALEICTEIGDRHNEGVWLDNLGIAYRNMGEVERAMRYHEKSLSIAQEINDRRGEGIRWGSLGLAYAAFGDDKRAIEFLDKALEISRELGDRHNEGIWLGNLGIIFLGKVEIDQSIEHFKKALLIAQEIGDRLSEAKHSWNLGLIYKDQGDISTAISYMQICAEYERSIDKPGYEERINYINDLRESLNQ